MIMDACTSHALFCHRDSLKTECLRRLIDKQYRQWTVCESRHFSHFTVWYIGSTRMIDHLFEAGPFTQFCSSSVDVFFICVATGCSCTPWARKKCWAQVISAPPRYSAYPGGREVIFYWAGRMRVFNWGSWGYFRGILYSENDDS